MADASKTFPVAQRSVKLSFKQFVIHPISDVHVGADRHQRDKLKKRIDYILEAGDEHRVILHGDIGDIRNKNGKSFAHGAPTPDEEYADAISVFTPLADEKRIDLIIPGNHEDRIAKEVGFDWMAQLAGGLGVHDRYSCGPTLLTHTYAGGKKSIQGLIHHGFGGGKLAGSSFNNLAALSSWKPDVDYVLMGHCHYNGGFKSVCYLDNDVHETVNVLTGTYVDHEGYAQKFGMKPSWVGTPRIMVGHDFGDDSQLHVIT